MILDRYNKFVDFEHIVTAVLSNLCLLVKGIYARNLFNTIIKGTKVDINRILGGLVLREKQ